ncbi:unnamed protein product [Microthlaspi erraticum]|uniref:Uncharacterized protein n=1 Tax=Microthlaspi erraticum TaxID=1685480 RepID=A0A6D2KIX7_9BRAS|nr:unnamed protein product [Microthlaspi erraticum]
MELMVLKPSFAKKLNEDGFSPLHLAVENKQAELALELVKFDPSLVRIRGRGGMTALHLVAKEGDVDLLTEFLQACPESIRDANANGETALHIAVMNKKYEELQVLTGWMQRRRKSDDGYNEDHVMNKRDRKGNTALHLAAYENDHKAVKQLLKCMSLNRNIKNKIGMTALDALRASGSHNMNKATEKIIISRWVRLVNLYPKARNVCLLEKTGHFPGVLLNGYGTLQEPHVRRSKKLSSSDNSSDHHSYLSDSITTSFLLSIALTFILLPVGRAYTWWYIFITVPLVCSYVISVYKKYSPSIFFYMYVIVALGFLIYMLVFYVRWKRTTQKKAPNPKTELVSEGSKRTMV